MWCQALGRMLIAATMLLLSQPCSAQTEGALQVGLLPTLPPLSLLRLYDPLRRHLQQALGRPVDLQTAANFRAHTDDLQASRFDLLITAPHFGVLAADQGYVGLFRYTLDLSPLIVVPKGSAIKEPRQIKGTRVASADRLAALSVVTEAWLRNGYGLEAGRDFQITTVANHTTAIRAAVLGDVDAAITGRTPLQQVPEDQRIGVETIVCPLVVPHQFLLAHPRLGRDSVEAIRRALASFPSTPDGQGFFAASGFIGFTPLTDKDVAMARPYLDIVRPILSKGP